MSTNTHCTQCASLTRTAGFLQYCQKHLLELPMGYFSTNYYPTDSNPTYYRYTEIVQPKPKKRIWRAR